MPGSEVKSDANEPRAPSLTSSTQEFNPRQSLEEERLLSAEGSSGVGMKSNLTADEVMLLLQPRMGSAGPQEQIRGPRMEAGARTEGRRSSAVTQPHLVSRWPAYLSPRQAKHPPRDPKIHGRLGLDPQRWWEREIEEGWRGGVRGGEQA